MSFMGEAKRRKQLGLMPTVHPFEVRWHSGELELIRGPEDPAFREQIVEGIRSKLRDERSWPRLYRREYVMTGLPDKLLKTAADVEAIPVPEHRRWVGELLLNYKPQQGAGSRISIIGLLREYYPLDEKSADGQPGHWLHLRQEHSFDGQKWESFAEPDYPLAGLRYLMQHPVTKLTGELVAEYRHTQSRDGHHTFEPEPPAGQRPRLEEIMRSWSGKTDEQWNTNYFEAADIPTELEAQTPVPNFLRQTIEVRKPAPMPGIGNIAHASVDNLDIFINYDGREMSFDGEHWEPFPDESLSVGEVLDD